MAYSIGLTLYTLGQRKSAMPQAELPPRPPGRLAWLHAPGPEAARSLLELGRRLVEEDGIPVLLTCPSPLPARPGLTLLPPPADTPAEARAFLNHWRPEIVVFAEGELRPALMHEAAERKLPLLLVDAREAHLPPQRDGWFPGLVRSTLAGFSRVMAVDEASARGLRKAGAAAGIVQTTGRMEEESAALPCSEAERAALARGFSTRPVWLAVDVPQDEEEAVIAAHRATLQSAHRVLLILVPQDPARADALAAAMEAEGWSVARRSSDEEPDSETEVFLCDTGQDYGLWYRLAPITYLGGSLLGAGCARDPNEAAALGSALICGPKAGAFGATYDRLGAARAMRAVGSTPDLIEAVGDLLSPDRAARLAQAAWAATSDGAQATETVMAEIRRLMDGEG